MARRSRVGTLSGRTSRSSRSNNAERDDLMTADSSGTLRRRARRLSAPGTAAAAETLQSRPAAGPVEGEDSQEQAASPVASRTRGRHTRTAEETPPSASSSSSSAPPAANQQPTRKRSRVNGAIRSTSGSAAFGSTGRPKKRRSSDRKAKGSSSSSAREGRHHKSPRSSLQRPASRTDDEDSAWSEDSDEDDVDDDEVEEVDGPSRRLRTNLQKKKKKASRQNAGKEPKRLEPASAKRGKARRQTHVDPITLEKIPLKHLFVITRENGTQGHFDAVTLASYMIASGDFKDPLTRITFTTADLQRLDKAVAELGARASVKDRGKKYASVMEAFHAKSKYKSAHCQRDALLGLERYLGEQIAEILSVIEDVNDGTSEIDEAEQIIIAEILPSFQHNFELLARADAAFASQSLCQYLSFLKGPPNRATPNRHGFRDFILAILQVFEAIARSPNTPPSLSASQINLLLRSTPNSSSASSSSSSSLALSA